MFTVAIEDGQEGIGGIWLRQVADASAMSLIGAVRDRGEPGSLICTGEWREVYRVEQGGGSLMSSARDSKEGYHGPAGNFFQPKALGEGGGGERRMKK